MAIMLLEYVSQPAFVDGVLGTVVFDVDAIQYIPEALIKGWDILDQW